MPRKVRPATHCKICRHPEARAEIESLYRKHIPMKQIALWMGKKYFPSVTEMSFYDTLRRHIGNNHAPTMESVKRSASDSLPEELKEQVIDKDPALHIEEKMQQQAQSGKKRTVEDYAQMLLEMGFTKEMLHKVNPKNILEAQKVLIEKEKAKNERDMLQIAMAKMMSGLIGPRDKLGFRAFGNEIINGNPEEVRQLEGENNE